eukprot:5844190-Lingulodinium_polyedra.AAC.1
MRSAMHTLPRLAAAFEIVAALCGLALNVTKCVLLVTGTWDFEEAREWLRSHAGCLGQVVLARKA